MSLITVGIHDNLMLSPKTQINEHGTLELVICSIQNANALLDAFEGNNIMDNMESSVRFYPPSLIDFSKKQKTAAEIGNDLLKIRHQFMQYAKIYATTDKVEAAIGGLNMFEGLGIPPEDMKKTIAGLIKEEFLLKVMANLTKKFYAFLVQQNAFSGKVTFRQKFLRQSKDKNFISVPTSTYDIWIEPMTIPKEASKISYTKWEIDNKKNSSEQAIADAPMVQPNVSASSLFSTPETDTKPEL